MDDLAATFELERSDLHIVQLFDCDMHVEPILINPIQRAASKGLVCGAGLTIHLITGETIKVNDTEVRKAALHDTGFLTRPESGCVDTGRRGYRIVQC